MKISAGIDIINPKRIDKILYKFKNRFIYRILSSYEINNIPSKKYLRSYISKIFSTKEAFLKALGSGFRRNINLSDISVYKNHLGKPYFYISGKTKNFIVSKKIKDYQLTITDEKLYIISLVFIEYY